MARPPATIPQHRRQRRVRIEVAVSAEVTDPATEETAPFAAPADRSTLEVSGDGGTVGRGDALAGAARRSDEPPPEGLHGALAGVLDGGLGRADPLHPDPSAAREARAQAHPAPAPGAASQTPVNRHRWHALPRRLRAPNAPRYRGRLGGQAPRTLARRSSSARGPPRCRISAKKGRGIPRAVAAACVQSAEVAAGQPEADPKPTRGPPNDGPRLRREERSPGL